MNITVIESTELATSYNLERTPKHVAGAALKTAFGDLGRSVDLGEIQIEYPNLTYDESHGRHITDFEKWLGNQGITSTGGILLLHKGHLDNEPGGQAYVDYSDTPSTEGCVVYNAEKLLNYNPPMWELYPWISSYYDTDNDGLFESVNNSVDYSINDVTSFYANRKKLRNHYHSRVFDHNTDGNINILDIVALYSNGSNTGIPIPLDGLATGLYQTGAVLASCIHEVAHTNGLRHNMGEMRVEERQGFDKTREIVVVSPMMLNREEKFSGGTNRAGKQLPEINNRQTIVEFVFGKSVHQNASTWVNYP